MSEPQNNCAQEAARAAACGSDLDAQTRRTARWCTLMEASGLACQFFTIYLTAAWIDAAASWSVSAFMVLVHLGYLGVVLTVLRPMRNMDTALTALADNLLHNAAHYAAAAESGRRPS